MQQLVLSENIIYISRLAVLLTMRDDERFKNKDSLRSQRVFDFWKNSSIQKIDITYQIIFIRMKIECLKIGMNGVDGWRRWDLRESIIRNINCIDHKPAFSNEEGIATCTARDIQSLAYIRIRDVFLNNL